MTRQADLSALMIGMAAELLPGRYVFSTVPNPTAARGITLRVHSALHAVGLTRRSAPPSPAPA